MTTTDQEDKRLDEAHHDGFELARSFAIDVLMRERIDPPLSSADATLNRTLAYCVDLICALKRKETD